MALLKMKRPLAQKELVEIFDTGNIPEIISKRLNYTNNDLENFYIGITRELDTDTIGEKMYKYITKKVIIQSNNIKLPVRRGKNIVTNWSVGNMSPNGRPIVIVLEVTETRFNLEEHSPLTYNLIGIFTPSEFVSKLKSSNKFLKGINNEFKDFSPLENEVDYRNDDSTDYIYDTKKNSYEQVRGISNQVEVDKSIGKISIENNTNKEDNNVDSDLEKQKQDYIDSLMVSKAEIQKDKSEDSSKLELDSVENITINTVKASDNLNTELDIKEESIKSILEENANENKIKKANEVNQKIKDSLIEKEKLEDIKDEVEEIEDKAEDDDDSEVILNFKEDDSNQKEDSGNKLQSDDEYFGI